MSRQFGKLFMLAFLPLLLLGCKKEKYTCGFSYYYLPLSLGFIGYSQAELDTIIIVQYEANTGMVNALVTDTIDGTQAYRSGDTTYAAYAAYEHSGFFKATGGIDYKVILPSVQKNYVITGIKEGPSGETWEQEEHCALGASQVRIAQLLSTVAGGDYINGYADGYNYFIFLKR